MNHHNHAKGTNCEGLFRSAYENRYTWPADFSGYKGSCKWTNGNDFCQGSFLIDEALKASVKDIENESIAKSIHSQLWEVSIHRVFRTFEQVHGQNTFTLGDTNEVGTEVLVGGKNEGDKYSINNNIITMVNRNIHGKLIVIYTKKIKETGAGYLSINYTSQYFDTISKNPLKGKSHFFDEFKPLSEGGPWVLTKREIETKEFESGEAKKDTFIFSDLMKI